MSDAEQGPKVFISHASEDKERFVAEFAGQLLGKGVQVWLDAWELGGGDSLPQRIFDQGIGQSDVVLTILSNVALSKPWVREEFDVAVVRRIAGRTRIIPILLDEGLDVPVAIEHLLHYNVPKQGIASVVAEVIRDIFNVSRRPPLGSPPQYVSSLSNIHGLGDPIDSAVFAAIIEHYRTAPPNMISLSNEIGEAVAPLGISYEQVLESIEILISQNLVDAQKFVGGQRYQLKGIPDHVWLNEEARSGLNIDMVKRQMLSDIVNTPNGQAQTDWYDYYDIHWRTVTAILRNFQRSGYIKVFFSLSGPHVQNVTAVAKRALRAMG